MDGRPMDPELLEGARSGDASAFEALAEARVGPMARTAMAILGSEAEARDAVKDALVIAWRELAALRDPQTLDAWLTRILANRAKRGLRGVATRRGREVPTASRSDGVEAGEPEAPTSSVERQPLERAFERQSVDERTLLVLHRLDGRSVAEIAAVLKAPEGTARARLAAAHRSLEAALGREGAMGAPDDDVLREMLTARADRLSPDAAGGVMAAVRVEVRGPRQGAAFSVLPVLTGRSPAVGAGWAAAAMVAVLVMVVLATRAPTTSPIPPGPASAPVESASPAAASAPASSGPVANPSAAAPSAAAHISRAALGLALAAGSFDGRILLVEGTLEEARRACAQDPCATSYVLQFAGPVVNDRRPGQPIVPATPAEGSTPLTGTFVVVPDRGTLILVGRTEGSLASPVLPSAVVNAYQPPDPGGAIALQAIDGTLDQDARWPCNSQGPCSPPAVTWSYPTPQANGAAGGVWPVTLDTPALGIDPAVRRTPGPLLVRTGTGPRPEVVARYDLGSSITVDPTPVTCRLAVGTGLPPCTTVVAQALADLPGVGIVEAVEVEQGASCPPGVACPTVEPDRAHVIVRTPTDDLLVELAYGAGGNLLSAVPEPLPTPRG